MALLKTISILFIYHPKQKQFANQILSVFDTIADEQINLQPASSTEELLKIDSASIKCLIFLDSNELNNDESIFEFIRKIEKNVNLKRILILPSEFLTNQNHFPTILHPFRYQQNALFFYKGSQEINENLPEIKKELTNFLSFIKEENDTKTPQKKDIVEIVWQHIQKLWRKTFIRTGVILVPIFALFIVVFINLLPQTLTALAKNENLQKAITPPKITSLWMKEEFNQQEPESNWIQEHQFRGIQPVLVSSTGATLFSNNPVVEDSYQLKSQNSWPVDQLQLLQISFRMDEPNSSSSKAAFSTKIINSENSALSVVCTAESQEGIIRCTINDTSIKAILANEIPFTLEEWHTLYMVFIPSRYSFQFFLDDKFYGEVEIPSVEYWKERNFNIILESNISNLDSSSFSLSFDNLLLSNQQR